MNKENYIEKVRQLLKTRDIFINQINLFFEANEKYKKQLTSYNRGDVVKLKKGTFLHGAKHITDNHANLGNIDGIRKEGIISTDFIYDYNKNKKTPLCASMWNIQNDMTLREYIELYSGATVRFKSGDGKKEEIKLIKYGELDKALEDFKNSEYWRWEAEQTKESRFMPCLSNNKVDVAFIFNMDNEYAKRIAKNNIFNLNMDEDIIRSFISEWFCNEFIYAKRTPLTTDRESAILFGVPVCFIEGILISRELEVKTDMVNKLRSQFSDCYICNLDGVVI